MAEKCHCGRFLHNIPAIHGAYWVCGECFLFDSECECRPPKPRAPALPEEGR